VLLLALLTGCVAPRLVDEARQSPYAELGEAYERLPRTTERFEVAMRDGTTLGVALEHVRGVGGAGLPTLVMQPGILADGRTWRFLAGGLAGAYDLVLVDPPGSGASDAPEPRALPPTAYSPTWLAEATLGAVEAFERAHGPREAYVLVGHSLGGAVALRALADPDLRARHGAVLGRVRGALLFNPADLLLDPPPRKLQDIASVSDFEVGVGERLGLLMKEVRTSVRGNVAHPWRDALRSEALRIEALLGRPATRHAMQATLLRFQPRLPDGVTLDRKAAEALAAHEAAIPLPLHVVWGRLDTTLTERQGCALCARLPTCRLHVLEGIGHSSHQERLDEHLPQVRELLAGLAAAPRAP
jgi:pimeloyl-ACP methyl ester carboxylesterase